MHPTVKMTGVSYPLASQSTSLAPRKSVTLNSNKEIQLNLSESPMVMNFLLHTIKIYLLDYLLLLVSFLSLIKNSLSFICCKSFILS